MLLKERREHARKLGENLSTVVQETTGGRTFKFSRQLPTLDPKEAVKALKLLQNAVELEGWTVVSAKTPKPNDEEKTTQIIVYAQFGAKCVWADCHFASIDGKYCYRHRHIATRVVPKEDRRIARPQGLTRAEGLARLRKEKKK